MELKFVSGEQSGQCSGQYNGQTRNFVAKSSLHLLSTEQRKLKRVDSCEQRRETFQIPVSRIARDCDL